MARLPGVLQLVCVKTPAFIQATLELSRPRLAKPVRDAYHAPYRSAARRAGIGAFVQDIPLDAVAPERGGPRPDRRRCRHLRAIPALLLWGPSDPVFADIYLRDLEARLPRRRCSPVRRREPPRVRGGRRRGRGARVGGAARTPRRPPARRPARRQAGTSTAASSGVGRARSARRRHRCRDDRDDRARRRGVDQLRRARRRRAARGRGAGGARRAQGDRVALLVPPGIDLTVCLYACWRMGAVVVIVDAGLGARGISRALKSADAALPHRHTRAPSPPRACTGLAGPTHLGRRRCAPTSPRALGVSTTLDDLRDAARAGRRRRPRPIPTPPRWCSPRVPPARPRACVSPPPTPAAARCARRDVRHHAGRSVRRRVRAVRALRPGDGSPVGRARHGCHRARHADRASRSADAAEADRRHARVRRRPRRCAM